VEFGGLVARAGLAVTAAAALALVSAGAMDGQAPRRGGTLVVAAPATPIFREPACLNPFLPRCGPGLTGTIRQAVLLAPFDVGPDLTWRPRLVSRVDVATRPRLTLTYRIRPEARWSDGVPITAADFVFTHEAWRRLGADDEPHRTHVRSVRAVDGKSVRVVLRSRLPGWQGRLFGSILPRHALRGQDLTTIWTDRIDDPRTARPIGSGPFLVGDWDRGRQIALVRNERYWGAHRAYLQRLAFRLGLPGAPADWLARGEVALAFGLLPLNLPAIRGQVGVTVDAAPGASWDRLVIRVRAKGHAALRDKLVRRAIAYGIDRPALARELFGDVEVSEILRDSSVFPPQSPHYEPAWRGYRLSPVRVRRLLDQAGCGRGADGVYSCGGERLRLRLVTTGPADGYRPRLLGLLAAQLGRVGIEVLPENATEGAFFGRILPSGDFDLAILGGSETGTPVVGCGGFGNFGAYCQRLVSRELDGAERMLDADKRAQALNAADARLAQDVPLIPLWQMPQSAASRQTVRGFDLALNAQLNFLWNAENWWLAG
jgi:peptide/nickel transport system substrate-binding protein